MAVRREPVRLVLEAGSFVDALQRMRRAVDANPIGDDETPADWMRRVIDAAYWLPEGWDD